MIANRNYCKEDFDSLLHGMDADDLPQLLDRLARLRAAGQRLGGLNEAQVTVLRYLGAANRFSRTPSAVADFLVTTRGTASQTLKVLAGKGLVADRPDPNDRRVRRIDLTAAGQARLHELSEEPGSGLAWADAAVLAGLLRQMLAGLLASQGGRSFGLCRTCCHHQVHDGGVRCGLLGVPLMPAEAGQICQEHVVAA